MKLLLDYFGNNPWCKPFRTCHVRFVDFQQANMSYVSV